MMPVYVFTSETGESIEEVFSIEDRPMCIERDGVVYSRNIVAEQAGVLPTPGNWPQVLTACEVNPEDRRLMMEKCEKYGVPTEYNGNGQPVVTDAKHRQRLLRLLGYHDKNAGYNGVTPD